MFGWSNTSITKKYNTHPNMPLLGPTKSPKNPSKHTAATFGGAIIKKRAGVPAGYSPLLTY